MSVPQDKLNNLFIELKKLDNKDIQQVVVVLEDFINRKKNESPAKPSDFRGALKFLDYNSEEECRKIAEDWD